MPEEEHFSLSKRVIYPVGLSVTRRVSSHAYYIALLNALRVMNNQSSRRSSTTAIQCNVSSAPG